MTTGNDERDKMLRRAIGECIALREEPVIGLVIEKLPADFDLLPEELADALAEMKLAPESLKKIEAPRAPEPEPPHIDTADSTPEAKISREQAQHLMEVAHVRLDNARIAVKIAQQDLGNTKGKLATAIIAWQQQADPLTPAERREREMRNHLASEQAKRAARGKPYPQAQAFVQKRMTNSGNHRGAFPRNYFGRSVAKAPGAQ